MSKSLSKSRTLLDVIKDEESDTAYKDLVERYTQTKSRKSIKDRLGLRRTKSASCTPSSQPLPPSNFPLSDIPINRRSPVEEEEKSDSGASVSVSLNRKLQRFQRSSSSFRAPDVPIPDNEEDENHDSNVAAPASSSRFNRFQSSRSIRHHTNPDDEDEDEDDEDEEEEDEDDEDEDEDEEEEEAPRMMSLFDLLAETDDDGGVRGYLDADEDEEDGGGGGDEGDEEENADGVEHACCVCMVRHKGAAFVPCGHSFCRLCSRELWVSSGNCPLCNGYILEILDIF